MLLLFLMIIPGFCLAQKVVYNITGISINFRGEKDLDISCIAKTVRTIIITDSTYTQIFQEKKTLYKIIKKRNNNYFKMSDGIKKSDVRISDTDLKKYKGFITEETDKGDINLWFNYIY